MAEMRSVCNYEGLVVQLTENEWYELNMLFCNSGKFGGENYLSVNSVLQSVFEVGLQVLKEEQETHRTLATLTGQATENEV